MARLKRDPARLRQIMMRQKDDRWGAEYVAATWATPTEAPSISECSILKPRKLGRRPFHVLSQGERWAALLALYHPQVWDIHEQRILFPQPIPNFLQGHPRAPGMLFPPLKGTLDVAERMGILSRHPTVSVLNSSKSEYLDIPFPFQGDLLNFLEDDSGPYAVNWSVKCNDVDFQRRLVAEGRIDLGKDNPRAVERQALEEIYYLEGGIPTRRVAKHNILKAHALNLELLFTFNGKADAIDAEVYAKLVDRFREVIGKRVAGTRVARQSAQDFGISELLVKDAFYQAVWRRELRLELANPIAIDRILAPERDDLLSVYADWFARG